MLVPRDEKPSRKTYYSTLKSRQTLKSETAILAKETEFPGWSTGLG